MKTAVLLEFSTQYNTILIGLSAENLEKVGWIFGEMHGVKDFETLAHLYPKFHIGLNKEIQNRLFTFYARNKNPEIAK